MAEARCTSNTRKVFVRADQATFSILDSQVQHVAMRGRPRTLLEGAEEVTLAQAGNTAQVLKRNRFSQANLNVFAKASQHQRVQTAARHHLLRIADLSDPRQVSESLCPPPLGKKTKDVVRC